MTFIGCILLLILAIYLILTYEKLQVSYKEIEEANENLEQRVKDRTKELALAHAEIKEILDNLDEVVLTFTPDLKIGSAYSPASVRILGVDNLYTKDIRNVIFSNLDRHNEDAGKHLFTLENIKYTDEFQWSISSYDLLKVTTIKVEDKERTLALKYSPIFEKDQMQKIVLVASDITEILALRATLAAQQEESNLREILLRENLLSDKDQLKFFYKECEPRCKNLESRPETLMYPEATVMLRDLHTLKGSSRSVGLKYFAKQVHILEDQLEPLRIAVSQGENQLPTLDWSMLENVLKLYREYEEVYKNLIERKDDSDPAVLALETVENLLKNSHNKNLDIISWIDFYKKETFFSLKSLFFSFKENITEIAKNLEKEIVFEDSKWDVYIDGTIRSALAEAFTHALRNAVDHGIEEKSTREKNGKNQVGTLRLTFNAHQSESSLRICDDGRGVNPKKVYEIAQSKGLIQKTFESMTTEEIIDLLFAPGFSTKVEISELSGRGIGLDAVRSSCKTFGIKCKILSEPNVGSCFELILPQKYVFFNLNSEYNLIKLNNN